MAAVVEKAFPTSKLNGLKLDEDEKVSPIIETVVSENGFKNSELSKQSPSVSSEEPSSPTGGKDEISSESDHNDGGVGLGQDVAGASGDSPVNEGDAGPFNISGYQRRLPPGVRDDKYGSWDPKKYETFTSEESSEYDLSRGQRLAVIFNHQDYDRDLPKRNGTEKDCLSIIETFESLKFEVLRYNDLTVFQIHQIIGEIQRRENLSCLALFILTHGEGNGLLFAKDTNYKLKDIVTQLLPQQCRSLAGKPKLIFIQACQGMEVDGGTKLKTIPSHMGNARSRHTSTDGDAGGNSYCIPNYSDFLIFQAAYHGHYSFRSASGSWFIQSLCHELNESSRNEDLLTILTRVSRHVAITRVSNVPTDFRIHDKKQIPLRQDTLLRTIYLKRGIEDNRVTPSRDVYTRPASSERETGRQQPRQATQQQQQHQQSREKSTKKKNDDKNCVTM